MHEPPEQAPMDEDDFLNPDDERVKAVEGVLGDFVTSDFEEGECFVDIGMNVKLEMPDGGGFACPLPAADAHAAILSHVLGIDLGSGEEYVGGKGGHYQRDELAGLKTVAGFRFRVPAALRQRITYVQLYTSDKTLIYNLNLPGHAKRVSYSQVLEDWDKWRGHHFQPLLQAFKNASESHVMYMRLEVRVDYCSYPYVQLRVPDAALRTWMYAVAPEDFWGWKYWRLACIYWVLSEWMKARAEITRRDLPKYLTLFLTLLWMANALVTRADDGSTYNEVRDASSVHTLTEEGTLVPVWPLRAHFLHSLRFSNRRPPRTSGDRLISPNTIEYLLKAPDIKLHGMVIGLTPVDTRQPAWATVRLSEQAEQALRQYPRAGVNRRRWVDYRSEERLENLFPNAVEFPGADSDDSAAEDYEERPRGKSVNDILSDIITDLPIQILSKAPVSNQKISWCMFAPRSHFIKPTIFQRRGTLEQAFPSHTLFANSPQRWDDCVNALLPTLDESQKDQKSGQQGLATLGARASFVTLQRDMRGQQCDTNVRMARDYVHRHWVWLPYGTQKNRLFYTGVCKEKDAVFVGPLPGAPWVVLNPALQ
ncbi:hypothetical protein FRC09_004194 [Ceratobasidium sp. 395]|nr:hypothetical protein FRC09_004194 [Ceratobasidium sp. 395]